MTSGGHRRVSCSLLHPRLLSVLALLAALLPLQGSASAPAVQILHPLEGQQLAASWQNVLIASIQGFRAPEDGTVAIYINDVLAARLEQWPGAVELPALPPGEHSIALSLQVPSSQHNIYPDLENFPDLESHGF
ncbi:hypothetical protein T484DRAFT_3122569 [Baffinella frigidus]|nr:hypothetical protein T484DRAFT_3122569 [Cryptophyta sp. CCMP2293]